MENIPINSLSNCNEICEHFVQYLSNVGILDATAAATFHGMLFSFFAIVQYWPYDRLRIFIFCEDFFVVGRGFLPALLLIFEIAIQRSNLKQYH